MSKKLPVIIDNNSGSTLFSAYEKLFPSLDSISFATGMFEIGAFLMLEGLWQQIKQIRILMGDETTRRTRQEIVRAIAQISDQSIENEKIRDDALTGLAAVRQAIMNRQIRLRIYSKSRFHAKACLMEAKAESPVDFAIAGSSNFTRPGLTENLELNLFTTDQVHIDALRNWYDALWKESEDVSAELLKAIEPHLKEYEPFTVYAKALSAYFEGREKTQDDWERNESVIYPLLSQYQKDGYHQALQIAEKCNGALICDGVGLGKTFIGLMLLERCLHEDKRVLLTVPKSAEESVWRTNIDRYLESRYSVEIESNQLRIERHTSFSREGLISEKWLNSYRTRTDVIIIDEAHHFRNPNSRRGKMLMDIALGKKIYMLTATPINNSLDDLYHLLNYFAQNQPDHFAGIRIRNLRKHFLDAEKRMEKNHPDRDISDAAEDEDFLRTDDLLRHVMIQRSRKYVKQSESINSPDSPMFPQRQKPGVISYSLKEVYASLYGEIREAFDRHNPFLSLAIYNTSLYHNDPDQRTAGYQKLLVGLIRTLLLKRLESSFKAFEASIENLLSKMADFLKYYSPERFENWESSNREWWKLVQDHILERLEKEESGTENEEEDDLPDFAENFDIKQHDGDRLLNDVLQDMNRLTVFLNKIFQRFYVKDQEGKTEDPQKDDKLLKLIQELTRNPLIKGQKVLIFTEFRETARYLSRQLKSAGLENVEQVDSGRNVKNREMIIRRFSPYYNCMDNSDQLSQCLKQPVDILISTDVLSEGLNLQDACLLINYDLHWNPVRLMQRVGRVDRRLNPEIEKQINRPAFLREKVFFWNFLPPDELEDLLHLKQRLDGKILRINKTLGIEGALLTPEDSEMSMKLFNERYEKKESAEELMRLEKDRLAADMPQLWDSLSGLPKRLFSGKQISAGFGPVLNRKGEEIERIAACLSAGIFACYRMPPVLGSAANDLSELKNTVYDPKKHDRNREVKWYFWDEQSGKITEDAGQTWAAVRCLPDTERRVKQGVNLLADARKSIEKHIKNTWLRDVQSPIGAKAELICWMEII
ncbi:MAG: helicase-related protein [Desulfococcaceae bacterium]